MNKKKYKEGDECVRKKIMTVFFMGFIIMGGQNLGALEMKKDKDTGAVTIENNFVKTVISPKGGNVVIFEDKIKGINHTVINDDHAGFGKLRIFENLSVDEFRNSEYAIKILKNDEDEVLLECACTAKKKDNPWCGFEIVKRYSLKTNENRLVTEWTINAHNNQGTLSPYMHNYLRLREKSYAFVQGEKGLFCEEIVSKTGACSQKIVLNPKEPWGAIIAPGSQDGLLGYDFSNHTKYIYFWMNEAAPTLEPLFNQMNFDKDSSWYTKYIIAPIRGMASCHFATADYAGGFTKLNSESVLKFLPFVDMGNVNVKILQENKEINTFTFEAKVGETLSFPVLLGDDLQFLTIEVSTTTGVNKHNIWASPLLVGQEKGIDKIAISAEEKKYAKLFVPREKFFVSPDAVTVGPFFDVENKLESTNKSTVRLIIDVPAEVKLINPIALYGACHDKITESDIEIKGKAYKRFELSKLSFRNLVFVKTSLPVGEKGIVFCQIKWDGGEDKVKEIPLESVHIPEAPFPKQLVTNIPGFGMTQSYVDAWSGFYDVMRRVGNNTISSAGSMVWGKDEGLKKFYDNAHEKGFTTFANFSPFSRHQKGQLYSEDIVNFCAVSLMDKTSQWPCPSYRGKAFQDYVKMIGRVAGLGTAMLCLDTEMWSGADYCFCDRCMKRFEEFMAGSHQDKPYIDPHVFKKTPEKYPEYIKIWDDFKAMLGCELYKAIADEFQKNIRQSNSSGSYALLTYSAFSPPNEIYSEFLRGEDLLKAKILSGISPSAYTKGDANKVAEIVRGIRAYLGNADIFTWLSAGGCIPDDEYDAVEFRYTLLENFLNGAKGYLILPWYGLDADDLREHAIAMNMLVPVEDIIAGGTVMNFLNTSDNRVKICGLQKNNEKLVLLSEYYDNKDIPVSFNIVAEEDSRVINMLKGDEIAKLSRGTNTIKTVIPAGDRAVLLYLGNRKFDFSARKDPVFLNDGKNVVPITKEAELPVIMDAQGILTINDTQPGETIVANPFYKITFRGAYIDIEFVKTGKKVKFYSTNSLRNGDMRIDLQKNKDTRREIKWSPNSKNATLVFSDKCVSESYDVESEIAYTFSNDSPIVKYNACIKQKGSKIRYSIAINKFWFGTETVKEMPFYSGGDPYCSNRISERKGVIALGDWKHKYGYFCIHDNENAIGIIRAKEQNAYLYVNDEQNEDKGSLSDRGNLSGCDVQSWDTEMFSICQYIYLGPVGQNAENLSNWAKKLYK